MRLLLPLFLALAVADAGPGKPPLERVIPVTAERFKYTPSVIELRVGEAVVLELTSLDRRHGFEVPELKVDQTIEPGKVTRVRLTPERPGVYPFHCNVFCGSGHEEMAGEIRVTSRPSEATR